MAAPFARQKRQTILVSSRADWRELITLSRKCASDVQAGVGTDDAQLRLMTLCRQSGRASTGVLDKEAGATIAGTARAFLGLLTTFSRPTMADATRVAMAPVVDAAASFLDDQLHELASTEFKRAHAGRPEVWG